MAEPTVDLTKQIPEATAFNMKGLMTTYLTNKDTLPVLISADPLNSDYNSRPDPLIPKLRDRLSHLEPEEATSFAQQLIEGIGTENDFWDVDRRDAALTLLCYCANEKLDPQTINDTYIKTLDKQTSDSDPLGTLDALATAGIIMATNIPRALDKEALTNAWNSVNEKMENNQDWQPIKLKTRDIFSIIGKRVEDIRLTEEYANDRNKKFE